MKLCLGCGDIASPRSKSGARCAACESQRNKIRNDRAYRAAPRYGRCVDCGAVGRLTLDHIVPLSAGGANVASNWQLMCKPCNSRKGARPHGSQGRSQDT